MKETNELKRIKTKIKALVLLIAFTAVMLIISTYAWFSTQRTVNISGIDGTVNVAEGLEISLDARNWSNSLNLSGISDLKGYVSENGYTTNNNIVPTEMLPVSASGSTGKNYLVMKRGTGTIGDILETVWWGDEKFDEQFPGLSVEQPAKPAYIAFDVFLRDSSRTNADVPLYLTTNSTVMVKSNGQNEEQYGLQNTIRVGFAKYGTTSDYKADQTTILAETANEENLISQVSIWEPNANYHVNYAVINNNKFTVERLTGAVLRDTDGVITSSTSEEKVKFTRDDLINTYALSDNVSRTSGDVGNVFYWKYSTTFIKQNTVKTKIAVPSYTDTTYQTPETYPGNNGYEMIGENPEKGVALTDTTEEQNTFTIVGNNVTRMRIYIWLEGQDVDCINYASHGGGITVNVGLQKDGTSSIASTAETETLIQSQEGTTTGNYLNSRVARNKIESVKLKQGEVPQNGIIETFDASAKQDGSITGYYTDTDGDGLYELTMVANNTIKANTDASFLFSNLSELKEVDLENLDLSTATSTAGMFEGCTGLTSVDVSSLNTSKVTDMAGMFYNCTSLTSLNWGSLDTSNVDNMCEMFYGCKNLTSLDVSTMDTSNVTDMYSMFEGCEKLTDLTLMEINSWRELYMGRMFAECKSLETIDMSNISIYETFYAERMFYNCEKLETIYVNESWNEYGYGWKPFLCIGPCMFEGCVSLVGQNGTTYDETYIGDLYARVDRYSTPGYFTDK